MRANDLVRGLRAFDRLRFEICAALPGFSDGDPKTLARRAGFLGNVLRCVMQDVFGILDDVFQITDKSVCICAHRFDFIFNVFPAQFFHFRFKPVTLADPRQD